MLIIGLIKLPLLNMDCLSAKFSISRWPYFLIMRSKPEMSNWPTYYLLICCALKLRKWLSLYFLTSEESMKVRPLRIFFLMHFPNRWEQNCINIQHRGTTRGKPGKLQGWGLIILAHKNTSLNCIADLLHFRALSFTKFRKHRMNLKFCW